MVDRASAALLFIALLLHGCSAARSPIGSSQPPQLRYKATGKSPQILALYEAWFGEPNHISIGYSSHDPSVIHKQIREAKSMGISAFVVDWYGDRDPFVDKSYGLVQKIASKEHFQVAMIYDETNQEEGATDETIADFTMFHDTYLSPHAPGHEAYLTYQGRPVIFIFPRGGHTDWDKLRAYVNTWNPAPLLIDENLPGKYADAFDGFYAWINPGPKGWATDGSDWGSLYLADFYRTMLAKYPNKIIVGGAWSEFNDHKASWSLNRHMSARCGQTFQETFHYWEKYLPADEPIPFILLETWNDYEEGSAIEPGIPSCADTPPTQSPQDQAQGPKTTPK